MNTTTIGAMLRAGVLAGALGFLPTAALADGGNQPGEPATTDTIPDHAQAEARGGETTTRTYEERTTKAPDHAQAEARGIADTTMTGAEKTTKAPDHAQAEDRGHESDQDDQE